jgi:hypothetical protein
MRVLQKRLFSATFHPTVSPRRRSFLRATPMRISPIDLPRTLRRRGCAAATLLALAACKDSPTEPVVKPGPPVDVALEVFGVATVAGSGGVTFVNPGRYAVLPQFAATKDFAIRIKGGGDSVPGFPFLIGARTSVSANVAAMPGGRVRRLSDVDAFHMSMRERERQEEANAIAFMQRRRTSAPINARIAAAQLQVSRDFRIQSVLGESPKYSTITARLVHTGTNVLVYVDEQSVVAGGFTDAEYAAFGALYDRDLYPIDRATFGAPSDLDGNGRVIVLYSPVVNRLTINSGECGQYVAGFFNPADLSGSADGNRAEVLYLSVPGEPTGGPACPRLNAGTLRNATPSTFIHELQHVISYNQHVLQRSGTSEETWLNEAMSHMAEELGGKLYETRYPCPAGPPCPSPGRANPSQLFPDSAQGFLLSNFVNAYDFFFSRRDFSLTSPTGYGTLEERGAGWLFLRWLVDQRGDASLSQLAQTSRTGTANIEAVGGESFRSLFADFLTATLLDDYPGAAPGQIPSRLQFTSRNLRAIYARLSSVSPLSFPTVYPLALADLDAASRLNETSPELRRVMKPGTFDLFQYTSTAASTGLTFRPRADASFAADLNAQVTVVRLPD